MQIKSDEKIHIIGWSDSSDPFQPACCLLRSSLTALLFYGNYFPFLKVNVIHVLKWSADEALELKLKKDSPEVLYYINPRFRPWTLHLQLARARRQSPAASIINTLAD